MKRDRVISRICWIHHSFLIYTRNEVVNKLTKLIQFQKFPLILSLCVRCEPSDSTISPNLNNLDVVRRATLVFWNPVCIVFSRTFPPLPTPAPSQTQTISCLKSEHFKCGIQCRMLFRCAVYIQAVV